MEKRSKKQGNPHKGKKQGIPKKQGKEGQGTVSRPIFDSQLPSPPSCLLKCLPNCLSPTREGFFILFQIELRGEGNCETSERQKFSRGNFCPATSICLFWPTGFGVSGFRGSAGRPGHCNPKSIGEGASSLFEGRPASPENVSCSRVTHTCTGATLGLLQSKRHFRDSRTFLQKDYLLLLQSI